MATAAASTVMSAAQMSTASTPAQAKVRHASTVSLPRARHVGDSERRAAEDGAHLGNVSDRSGSLSPLHPPSRWQIKTFGRASARRGVAAPGVKASHGSAAQIRCRQCGIAGDRAGEVEDVHVELRRHHPV